ncbi:hypothetical protein HC028_07235 [Planosporangium flavigriseum]|uniref:Uncharacterized protein n=1 Tax=Planosporangium flavigriseum TaxID=373681 RepID=A0A8J3LNM8_9ACTN|nr:hypothetical protein [Planosporangium flavigriseum]NJC64305.1 hypothetical protein [Planosporangium flavigriseum]GIG73828.1 hypothetical protein Pfl04_22320 [Planosporangium flavigriseum]
MAPLLTLITYVVAAALAIGYVCEAGLPSWRRASACILGMILAVGAGQLLTSSNPLAAYATGIPSLLALGIIMIAPERTAKPSATPRRRAGDRPRPESPTAQPQLDRRAPHRRAPRPVLTDSRGTRLTGPASEVTYAAQTTQVTHAPTATRRPGSAGLGPHPATDGHLAERRHQSRRGTPRSLSRISRCRYR